MRCYLIEDLEPVHVERLEKKLADMGMAASMQGLFWIDVPRELLSPEQKDHADECGPHSFGLETGDDWIKLELLARARGKIRCSCIAYATAEQRAQVMDFLDNLLKDLDIPV